MKFVLVIFLNFLALSIVRSQDDSGSEIEIVKQRLVKFPEETYRYQSGEKAEETRRILEEINKINIALGYVKKSEPTNQRPAILDSDTYLFPMASYHPVHSFYNDNSNNNNVSPNAGSGEELSIPGSIRHLSSAETAAISRKILHPHSIMIPHSFNVQDYKNNPAPFLRTPTLESAQKFSSSEEEQTQQESPKLLALASDIKSILEYAKNLDPKTRDAKTSDLADGKIKSNDSLEEVSSRLLKNVKEIVDEMRKKKSKTKPSSSNSQSKLANLTSGKLYLIPSSELNAQNINLIPLSKPGKKHSQRTNTKNSKVPLKPIATIAPSTLDAERKGNEKGPIRNFFTRLTQQSTTLPPTTAQSSDSSQNSPEIESYEDYEAAVDPNKEEEKFPFIGHHTQMIELQKHALKEHGIIIQRLRVRKGGIAIAGPGGVATAGSGGTAIVGPGGIALTHPRSLTIAGPGAKVYAIPRNYDLGRAALFKQGRNLPAETRLVATGPTIYYNQEESPWQTTSLASWPNIVSLSPMVVPKTPLIGQHILHMNSQLKTLPLHYGQHYQLFPVKGYSPMYQIPYNIRFEKELPSVFPNETQRKSTAEPTTESPETRLPKRVRSGAEKPVKDNPLFRPSAEKVVSDFQYVQAIQQDNSKFVVEKLLHVPESLVLQSTELLRRPVPNFSGKLLLERHQLLKNSPATLILQEISGENQEQNNKENEEDATDVKVTATGHAAADRPVPEIPVGIFFDPYFGSRQNQLPSGKTASLILEPQAKAIAGNGGTAFSAPVSRAILKKGISARVLFRPQSVAIAGVGGIAHAQADLILEIPVNNPDPNVVRIPYYGGARGQYLEITRNKDGSETKTIITRKGTKKLDTKSTFQANLQNIQDAAARLVAIQEYAKKRGSLSPTDNKIYAENLYQLGAAAQELAKLQNQDESTDFRKLFQASGGTVNRFDSSVYELGQKLDDNDVGEAPQQVNTDSDGDSVAVNAPAEEASVAEAKPISLSIAGVGGAASSRPVATAIAGEDGLAISRPIATAIAGVSPGDISQLGIPIPNNRYRATHQIQGRGNIRRGSQLFTVPEHKYRLSEDGILKGPTLQQEVKSAVADIKNLTDTAEQDTDIVDEPKIKNTDSPQISQQVIPGPYIIPEFYAQHQPRNTRRTLGSVSGYHRLSGISEAIPVLPENVRSYSVLPQVATTSADLKQRFPGASQFYFI